MKRFLAGLVLAVGLLAFLPGESSAQFQRGRTNVNLNFGNAGFGGAGFNRGFRGGFIPQRRFVPVQQRFFAPSFAFRQQRFFAPRVYQQPVFIQQQPVFAAPAFAPDCGCGIGGVQNSFSIQRSFSTGFGY